MRSPYIIKMNKMIRKKTGASFLVVYVIYVSLVYTDSKKAASGYLYAYKAAKGGGGGGGRGFTKIR